MCLLFAMDARECDPRGARIVRPSARGILRREGRVGLICSRLYDLCKLPGSGPQSECERKKGFRLRQEGCL